MISKSPLWICALADRDWVHFAPGSGLGDMLDQACAAAGLGALAEAFIEILVAKCRSGRSPLDA